MVSWCPPNRIPSLSLSQKINLGSKASINLIQDLTPSLCYILDSNLGLLVGLLVYSFYDGAYFFTIMSSCSSRWRRHQNISVKLKWKTQKFHVEDASYKSWLIHLFQIGVLVWELLAEGRSWERRAGNLPARRAGGMEPSSSLGHS